MLTHNEKAYCRGLEALRNKDYPAADKEFRKSKELFGDNKGFKIITEAVAMLAFLYDEKKKIEIEIEENHNHGKETIICGQSFKEKAQ